TDEGAIFVFLGSAAGVANGNPATAATKLERNQANAGFGVPAAAGDVNGDGYADLIVGAPSFSGKGAAFIYLGSASGVAHGDPTAYTEIDADQPSVFGFSVASAGDVNGDGYADVVIGAPAYASGQTNEGAAFVYLGTATGIASGTTLTASARLESNQAQAL